MLQDRQRILAQYKELDEQTLNKMQTLNLEQFGEQALDKIQTMTRRDRASAVALLVHLMEHATPGAHFKDLLTAETKREDAAYQTFFQSGH